MKRQYAISVLLKKNLEIKENLQLVLDYGTTNSDKMEDNDKLKDNALSDFIENNEIGKDFIKDGYSIFLVTFCLLPLIDED